MEWLYDILIRKFRYEDLGKKEVKKSIKIVGKRQGAVGKRKFK